MKPIKSSLFAGVSESDCKKMMECFKAVFKSYKDAEIVTRFGSAEGKIGIMQSGNAVLERVDYNGRRYVLESMQEGDVFGETVAFSNSLGDSYSVICQRECSVAFIGMEELTKKCKNACECHSTIIANMLSIVSKKAMSLSERIEVLSNRSIREKLMYYFMLRASKSGSPSFELPFSVSALADYICVDRSAMMREMKNMKEEGVISSYRRKITIIDGGKPQSGSLN